MKCCFFLCVYIYLCHTYLIVSSHTFKPKPKKKMGLSLQKLAPGSTSNSLVLFFIIVAKTF